MIEYGISVTGNFREVVDNLNTTDKRLIFHLIKTVQLPGSKFFDDLFQSCVGNKAIEHITDILLSDMKI